jgi:hypothetical protein
MSELDDLQKSFAGGGLPVLIFAGAIVVAFIVGWFSQAGALALLALGVLAAVIADFAAPERGGGGEAGDRAQSS